LRLSLPGEHSHRLPQRIVKRVGPYGEASSEQQGCYERAKPRLPNDSRSPMRATINTNSESTMSETLSIAAQLMAAMAFSPFLQRNVSHQRRWRALGFEAGRGTLFRAAGPSPSKTPRGSS
jgi:hypothetical protein